MLSLRTVRTDRRRILFSLRYNDDRRAPCIGAAWVLRCATHGLGITTRIVTYVHIQH